MTATAMTATKMTATSHVSDGHMVDSDGHERDNDDHSNDDIAQFLAKCIHVVFSLDHLELSRLGILTWGRCRVGRMSHGLPKILVGWARVHLAPPIFNFACMFANFSCACCGQLILKKISKIGATRCHILKLKCTRLAFGWDSAPDHAGGAYSATRDLQLLYYKGPTSKGREGKESGRERGRAGKER